MNPQPLQELKGEEVPIVSETPYMAHDWQSCFPHKTRQKISRGRKKAFSQRLWEYRYLFPVYDPKGSIKIASENLSKCESEISPVMCTDAYWDKRSQSSLRSASCLLLQNRATLLPSLVWPGSFLSNPVTSLAGLNSMKSRQEQAYLKKPKNLSMCYYCEELRFFSP